MGTPGGQEHQVYEFIRHAEERHNHSLVVASDPLHEKFSLLYQTNTTIVPWKYYGRFKIPRYPRALRRWFLRWRMRDTAAEVVIGYNFLSRKTLFSALRSQTKAAWVYYDGCGMWLDSPGEVGEVLARYDCYGALCPASAFLMREKFGLSGDRIELLPYGVSDRYLQDQPSRKAPFDETEGASSLPRARLRLLFVGRLIARKGVNTLLRALQGLGSSVQLLIVGDGPERGQLERLAARLDVQDQTTFYGFQPDPYPFYRDSDLFVFPTTFEPFGKVVVEAGAMSLPVITTNVDGPAMMVDHGRSGFLLSPSHSIGEFQDDFRVDDFPDHVVDMKRRRITEPRMVDPEELAERIRFYLDHPSMLEEHGRSLREAVRRRFGMETFTRRLETVCERLRDNPDSPSTFPPEPIG